MADAPEPAQSAGLGFSQPPHSRRAGKRDSFAKVKNRVENSCNASVVQTLAGAFCYTCCIMTNDENIHTAQQSMPEQEKHTETVRKEPKRAVVAASWIVVIVVLGFIFAMSCRDGYQIDNASGIFSTIKQWLAAQALNMTGHEVDVSPVGHFCEYRVLGAALTNALRFHLRPEGAAGAALVAKPIDALSKWAPAIACALSSVYGVTDEFHQIFTPGRSCDPADWAVDTIAAAIGAIVCYLILKAMRKRRENR